MGKLAFAACLVSAILAAGWLGTQLAGGADPGPGRAAARPETTPKRSVKPAARNSKSWAERASAVCARGLEDTRTVLDARPEPGASEHAYLLQVLGAAVQVEKRVVRQLDALPLPRTGRRSVRKVIGELDATRRSGEKLLASLRVRWDESLLERTLRENGRAAGRLRLQFLGLGATGCAAYLQG